MTDELQDNKEAKTIEVPFWFSSRFGIAVLLFFGVFCTFSMRVNINMSIVCMINHTALDEEQNKDENNSMTSYKSNCGSNNGTNYLKQDGPFNWDRSIQGHILGAFFWPYAISQIPSSIIVNRYGARKVFGITMLLSSVLTVLIPTLSRISYFATITVRALLGVLLACCFISCQYVFGRWIPLHERSRLSALPWAGVESGIIFTYAMTGLFCKHGSQEGWSYIFYLTGAGTFIWSLVWTWIVSDAPEQCKRISVNEKTYITSQLQASEEMKVKLKVSIPWRSIITSWPVIAVMVANFTSDWAFHFIGTYIPSYLNDVFDFDVETNGLISALPSLPHFILTLIGGWLSDFIQNRYLSRTNTRKLMNSVSFIIPALLLLALGFIDCSRPALAITCLTIGMAMRGFRYAGFVESPLDISPQFAGIIFGISNSLGAVGAYLSTVMTANITTHSAIEEWRICFFITSAIEIFGALFFIVFASSDKQILNKDSNINIKIELVTWKQNGGIVQNESKPKEIHM